MTTSNMKKPFSIAPLVIVAAMILAGIYWVMSQPRKAETTDLAQAAQSSGFSKALATGPMAGVVIHSTRKPIPYFEFEDGFGGVVRMGVTFKGKVILLNLWATWCTPCRKEMPDLNKLQQSLGSSDFEVVALSVDRKGQSASDAFLKEIGANSLDTYIDSSSDSLARLQVLGLPASILIDRNGMEVARILGPAPWASPEAQAMIKALINEK